MEGNIERECSALGGLFQQIVADMKNGTPLWEDFISKATKLHTCLRATINAISSYLDAFQKIADAATNTRGATKEIGTALTRICLRHRAVEARLKTFTSAIVDCLVNPLQDKLEEWKKSVVNLDKEHTKDFKRARSELKKRSTDTMRLQKKARKNGKTSELQRALLDFNERRHTLEEAEKKAVRAALVEERSRFCLFVAFLKPVVDEEVAMLSELSHLQEVVDQLEKHTADPYALPPASEEIISEVKGSDTSWIITSPPSSPSSLGSRKSSMCSISSLNSSSSGSSKSHHSPSHNFWTRSLSQFGANHSEMVSSGESTPSGEIVTNNPTSTWPNLQDTLQFERAASAILNDRPHTISSAYEKGHQRVALSVYTFTNPESQSQPTSPSTPVISPQIPAVNSINSNSLYDQLPNVSYGDLSSNEPVYKSVTSLRYSRPPLPQRCSSLERPSLPPHPSHPASTFLMYSTCSTPTNKPTMFLKNGELHQPTYVNMHELASLAANKGQEMSFPPPPPELTNNRNYPKTDGKNGSTSESLLESSSGYGSQTVIYQHSQDESHCERHLGQQNTLSRRGSISSIKPPPPIRRTPSINRVQGCGGLDQFPPPPAYLLESKSISSSIQSMTSSIVAELQQRQRSPSMDRRKSCLTNVYPCGTKNDPSCCKNNRENMYSKNERSSFQSKAAIEIETKQMSVADTVRALTELKHQPASPVSVRRSSSIRSVSADRHPSNSYISPRKLDPRLCHDSLMEQIKKGTLLRKTRTVNDRSAPHIH
ncbi:uncharacterized protein [Bemisia tabaci]|uniref:uncharacterized protein isoform X2 n=1 Tax=Bemisia tabaci TaxID=7038 RepID=UPI0008F9A0E7|nr:PREDICTED: uncharacterized protein LOC109038091 isoform X2 [Bemisia tabaci]